ncbi:MAG: fructose-bisphosphate aldolase class I [Proteobacteria bacterium]|nr:fructose-bisphosphate aldolase class I [Pseudomonadota bacterium]
MNEPMLVETAQALVGGGRGLLAMDESNGTCNKRFAAAGIPQTVEMRRAYRELIATTPFLGQCVSGAILYDETIRQRDSAGVLLLDRLVRAGIIPGIKVDRGAKPLALHAGETVTEGLDGLRERLEEYATMGARFAKWRGVISLGDDLPSRACIVANAQALARYAALCQEAGLVPIVEPEVLMTGGHGIERCLAATEAVLRALFEELEIQGIVLEAVILKPNMILPGLTCPNQRTVEDVAEETVQCLLRCVPAAVAGIAFLSGGQSGELASARLDAINLIARDGRGRTPWPLVFSFGRAIQQPALTIWHGEDAQIGAAQRALYHRADCNHAALRGDYTQAMETRPVLQRAS